MTFNEANTVEAFIRDRLCGGVIHHTAVGSGRARRRGALAGLGWHFLAPQNLGRLPQEVLVESHVRDALIRLNPEITAQPERADEVTMRRSVAADMSVGVWVSCRASIRSLTTGVPDTSPYQVNCPC